MLIIIIDEVYFGGDGLIHGILYGHFISSLKGSIGFLIYGLCTVFLTWSFSLFAKVVLYSSLFMYLMFWIELNMSNVISFWIIYHINNQNCIDFICSIWMLWILIKLIIIYVFFIIWFYSLFFVFLVVFVIFFVS